LTSGNAGYCVIVSLIGDNPPTINVDSKLLPLATVDAAAATEAADESLLNEMSILQQLQATFISSDKDGRKLDW
jgi:hypothetical protein